MMTKQELSVQVKQIAIENGADLVGIVNVADLQEHAEDILRILPEAKRVIVVAARHSLAAIQSDNIQMGQLYSNGTV
jgi:hypothetical protein